MLAGEAASTAHPMWTDAPFEMDQTIAFELGACRKRYNCGLARTVHLGRPPTKLLDTAKAVEEGIEAGSETALSEALHRCQQDPRLTLARARSPDTISALETETEQATKLGVFGAPSLVVRGEVFWGDDRLDDALSWARVGHVI